jgi:hypothetical protein
MRRWQTMAAADLSDPGFAPAGTRMSNQVIEPLLSHSDDYLKFRITDI